MDYPYSHCVMHPHKSDITCKCDDGYFGRAGRPNKCKRAGKSISNAILKLFINTGFTTPTHEEMAIR